MSSRIIYKNLDNSIGILIPTEEVLKFATLLDVAEKDVPHNLPYWIVPTSDIPTDRTFRNAWEIDESFGEPDGFGGESNEFDEELLRKYYEVINANKN
jgi:hypothetical protein